MTDIRRKQVFGALLFFGFVTLLGIKWNWTLALMAGLLVHENGHALMARARGLVPGPMYFHPFGMVVLLPEIPPRDAPAISLAGPILGMLPAIVSYVAYLVTGTPAFVAFAIIMTWVNLFNLLPLNPLDGGRVAHAVLGAFSPYASAVFAGLCCVAAIGMAYYGGLLFLLIAWFGWMECKREFALLNMEKQRRATIARLSRWYFVKPTPNAVIFARKLRERFPKEITPGEEAAAVREWQGLEARAGGMAAVDTALRAEPRPQLTLRGAGLALVAFGLTMWSLYFFADMLTDIVPFMDAYAMMRR